MSRLTIVLLFAGLMGPAWAADAGNKAPAGGLGADKAANAAAPDKVIADILAASGMRASFDKIPRSMVADFRKGLEDAKGKNGPIPAELQQALEASVKDAFTAQGFAARVSRAMKQDYSEKNYQELLDDLSTPLAKRMAELGAKDEPTEQELGAFLTQLAGNPLPAQRIDTIHRLDLATHASDMVSTVVLSVNKGVLRGTAGGSGKCVSEGQLARTEAAMVQNMEAQKDNYSGARQTALTYAYRDVSDADLAEYVKIYEKANAKHIQDVIYAAMVDEYGDASARMGRGMVKAIRDRQAASGNHACDNLDAGGQPRGVRVAQAAGQAAQASGVPAVAPAQPAAQPSGRAEGPEATPKSSVPLEKRKGGDITQCLEAGSKSDKDIAACAEKYRP